MKRFSEDELIFLEHFPDNNFKPPVAIDHIPSCFVDSTIPNIMRKHVMEGYTPEELSDYYIKSPCSTIEKLKKERAELEEEKRELAEERRNLQECEARLKAFGSGHSSSIEE